MSSPSRVQAIIRDTVAICRLEGRLRVEIRKARDFVNKLWDESIIPQLCDYVRIPNKSPHFDPDWQEHGHMDTAVQLLEAVQEGRLPAEELSWLPELADTLEQTSVCGLGQVALNPILSMMRHFPEEVPGNGPR